MKLIPSLPATCCAPCSLASKTVKPSSLGTIETLIVAKLAAAPAGEGATVMACLLYTSRCV